jgi:hypothetical protein
MEYFMKSIARLMLRPLGSNIEFGEPTIMFRPLGRNIEFGCNTHIQRWTRWSLTLRKVS